MVNSPAIEARGLRKRFGAVTAVDGLDLSVPEGEIFGLVGPDGAGKTTTFRLLLGLMRPDEGEARLAGYDMRTQAREAQELAGYVAQAFTLYWDLSVAENIRFTAEIRSLDPRAYRRRAAELLELTELSPFTDRLARNLSGGMRRKLALVCALLHGPRILILDEPTTGVDPVSRREFWRLLYRLPAEGVTLVVSTPYLDEAERCHTLGFMARGQLLAVDSPEGLIARMPDDLVRIVTPKRAEAWRLLSRRPEVRWVDASGGALRVAFDGEVRELEGGRAFARMLTEAGLPVEACEPMGPTLSDVFTTLAEQAPKGEAA